jgi:predicted ATPase
VGRFIAREKELAELQRLLDAARLVTVWGAGGIGKSRLVEEAVRRGGRTAFVVRLGGIASAEALARAIGSTTSDAPISARTGDDLVRQTGRRLRSSGPLRLVLDGFEHLVSEGRFVLTTLLEEAPELAILVTSRQRLKIDGEAALELGPLSELDAAALFAERAGRAEGSPRSSRLLELLKRLEGIPLAIELAAARLEADAEPEQDAALPVPTMRGAVEWSWGLLSPAEQRALTACAVFRGSFTLAAAEHVIDVDPSSERGALVRALREKSLLRLVDDGGAAARYALYDVVRELALEELRRDVAREGALVERYDAWLTKRAQELAHRVDKSGDIHAREGLARELENLLEVHARALGRWTTDASAPARALETLLAADAVLSTRASARARLAHWNEACRSISDAGLDARLVARARGRRGQALAALGELADATLELEAAVRLARGLDDASLLCEALLDLGVVLHARRDYPAAREAYVAALGDGRAAGEQRTLARVAGNLAALHHDEGRADAARRSYEKSLDLAAAAGDARIEGVMNMNLAVLEHEEQNVDRALALFGRAITLLEQAKDLRLFAIAQSNRGMLQLERGRVDDALIDHEAAFATLRRVAEVRSEGLAGLRLAVTLSLVNRADDARGVMEEAAAALARSGDEVGLDVARVAAGFVALADGRIDEARAVAASPGPGSGAGERSDDARTLLRLLRAELARRDAALGPPAEPGPALLAVAADASAFRAPGGRWFDAAANPAAQRILAALAALREREPEGGIEAPELIAAGWPDGSGEPATARSRLYAAIGWLRARGLEGILQRRPQGYFLDPEVPFARASPVEGALTAGDDAPPPSRRRRR